MLQLLKEVCFSRKLEWGDTCFVFMHDIATVVILDQTLHHLKVVILCCVVERCSPVLVLLTQL